MRQSQAFITTLHDAPSDAEVSSHKLLAQAGFIYKLSAGIYAYSPAMWRVLKKVSNIVREEMDGAGAQEVMLPIVQPRSIWDKSGRWDGYVNENILFHLKDRKDAEICLGPTHEEVITTFANNYINSYKQLPVNLYQIQTKFRDEIRPRFGLMRAREFIMKDAYSFDVNEEALDVSYEKMNEAYHNIFSRCGLEFVRVEADSGAIGGSGSHEFVVTAETGEDLFLYNNDVGYAANQERAVSIIPDPTDGGAPQEMEKVSTPERTTVVGQAEYLNIAPDRIIKTLVYKAVFKDEERFVAALTRGDREVNEVKLKNKLDCLSLELVDVDYVKKLLNVETGFVGPIGLPEEFQIISDDSLKELTNVVIGANETGYHFSNVNFGRDLPEPEYTDLNLAVAGDGVVGHPDQKLEATRGIEVGHIFKLGTKYSNTMEAMFTAESGKPAPFVMGCYGIGVSRIASAAIEQNNDENGMIWPLPIAPWQVHLICLNPKKEEQSACADKIYEELTAKGIEVLYDDRKVSPGNKFNDADLIGIPLRINVGRDAGDNQVEFCERKNTGDKKKVGTQELAELLSQYLP